MSASVRVCSKADLPPAGEAREVVAGERAFCIANSNGIFTAVDNVCPHRQGPLGQGIVEHGKVVCPWHGWAFDLKTGISTHSEASAVAIYPLEINGEDVLIVI